MATLRAGDDLAVLALAGLLNTAVEEEGHMGVLLRLGNAELSIALAGDILTEDIGQLPVGGRPPARWAWWRHTQ